MLTRVVGKQTENRRQDRGWFSVLIDKDTEPSPVFTSSQIAFITK